MVRGGGVVLDQHCQPFSLLCGPLSVQPWQPWSSSHGMARHGCGGPPLDVSRGVDSNIHALGEARGERSPARAKRFPHSTRDRRPGDKTRPAKRKCRYRRVFIARPSETQPFVMAKTARRARALLIGADESGWAERAGLSGLAYPWPMVPTQSTPGRAGQWLHTPPLGTLGPGQCIF